MISSWKLIRITVILFVLCDLIKSDSNNEFGYCLKDSRTTTLSECAGRKVLSLLQNINLSNNFTMMNGFILSREDNVMSRSVDIIDQDPMDFRGILENAGVIFSQRSLKWKLSSIYPGLHMRIGPSADVTSMLEFVLDPEEEFDENERNIFIEEPSTARIITRKFLLPFLLGLKFNLVTIIPLIFTAIVFLCQKAAILGKIALFISSILGFGGIFSLGAATGGLGGFAPIHHHGFGGGHHHHHGLFQGHGLGSYADSPQFDGYVRNGRRVQFDKPREYVAETVTPLPQDNFYDYEKNVLMQDRNSNAFERNFDQTERTIDDTQTKRSFFWKTI